MSLYESWAGRGLFVSSTFEDMHAERDYLQRVVFPALADRLRATRHRLEPVDLRWGIDTLAVEGGDEQRQLLVLNYCLDSIEKCRPCMIVLLGDRYGWIPPHEFLIQAAETARHYGDTTDRSVTALEIDFGVLESREQVARTHFFQREMPYEQMAPEDRARYSDAEAGRPVELLDQLRERIAAEVEPERLHTYRVGWDSEGRRVTDLEQLGQLILEHVGRDLEELTRAAALRAPRDWQEAERLTLDEFLDFRTRIFLGRDALLAECVDFCLGDANDPQRGRCLIGESGAGKSSLFAALHRRLDTTLWRQRLRTSATPEGRQHLERLERANVLVLGHAAGISRRSMFVHDLLRRWIGELARGSGQKDPATDDMDTDTLQTLFAQVLRTASGKRRVVLLLDALNQMERSAVARFVQWLPRTLPENVRIVATTLPGDEGAELERRSGWTCVSVPALDETAIDVIFAEVCQRLYSREGHRFGPVRQALREKTDPTTGARSGGNALWLRLALDLLNQLDEDFFVRQRLEQYRQLPADQRLTTLLVEVVNELPGDVAGLYSHLLERAERVARHFGRPEWARYFACLLGLSRSGLRESDLQALLTRLVPEEPWSDLRLAALRRTFTAHLVERGDLGEWDYFHAQIREAVRRRYLTEEGESRRLHRLIAEHLAALDADDLLRQREIMYHMLHSGETLAAARYFARTEGPALDSATAVLAQHIVQQGEAGLDDVLALMRVAGLDDEERLWTASQCQFKVLDTIANFIQVAPRVRLLEAVHDCLGELAQRRPQDSHFAREYCVTLGKLGDLYRKAGRGDEALRCYEAGTSLARRLVERLPDGTQAQRDLSISLNILGDLYRSVGRGDDARRCYDESLGLARPLAERLPDDVLTQGGLVAVLNKLGDLHLSAGGMDDARRCYVDGFETARRLAERFPHGVEIQRDLSLSYWRLGELALAIGQEDGARDFLQRYHECVRRLAEQMPDDVEAQRNLTVAQCRLGDLFLRMGDTDEARPLYEADLAIARRLAEQMPDDVRAQRDLSVSLDRLGDLSRKAEQVADARRYYEEGLSIRRRLVEQLPEDVSAQRDLGVVLERLSALPDVPVAQRLALMGEAVNLYQRLTQQMPGSAEAARTFAVGLFNLCRLLHEADRQEDSNRALFACHQVLQGMRQRGMFLDAWAENMIQRLDGIFRPPG